MATTVSNSSKKYKNLLLSSDSHFQREVTQGDSTIAHE